MQIVIVGAGVSGLLTSLALRNHLSDAAISIKIVESAKSAADLPDGSSSLAPNAIRSLLSIAPELLPALRQRGFSGGIINIENSSGEILGDFKAGTQEKYGDLHRLVISNRTFREVLIEMIGEDSIQWGKTVTGLFELSSGVQIAYTDGTTEAADLVVGADGAKSIVKDAIFRGEYPNAFKGTVNVGSIIPVSNLPTRFQKDLTKHDSAVTFGKRGFFAYTVTSSSPAADLYWWSVYFPPAPTPGCPTLDEVKSQFLHRIEGWKAPFDDANLGENTYKDILQLAFDHDEEKASLSEKKASLTDENNLIVQPRYTSSRLPHLTNASSNLSKGRIILVGEAAHVIPPETIQNVAFTTEDVAVYALLLKHYSGERGLVEKYRFDATVFEKAAKGYDAIRVPRINRFLKDVGNGLDCESGGEMGWIAEKLRDWAAAFFCKISECVMENSFAYDPKKAVDDYVACA